MSGIVRHEDGSVVLWRDSPVAGVFLSIRLSAEEVALIRE